MAAAAIYGMVGWMVSRERPRFDRVGFTATTTLVLLIGVSRVFLGVHWPTDVLAGFAAGAFLMLGAVYLMRVPT